MMKPLRSNMQKYVTYFNEGDLMDKIKTLAGKAGSLVVYYALILYYLLSDKEIPAKGKIIMVAALGYFILPADLIADIIPVLGFTDDIAFLSYAINSISNYLTPEIIEKAQHKLGTEQTLEDMEHQDK